MADEKQRAEANMAHAKASARGPQSDPTAEKAPEEVRYEADELRENAQALLNVSPHAVAGALATASNKTFTLEDAQALVNEFLKREEDQS